jgi:hypothetical protein
MHANFADTRTREYGTRVERNQKHGRLNLRGVNKGPSESLESHAWHLGANKVKTSSQRIGLIKILVL